MSAHGQEARRSLRLVPATPVPVVDVMWDRVIGFVQDVSAGGLKLIANHGLVDNGLYQVQFDLGEPGPLEPGTHVHAIEAGVQVVNQRHGPGGGTVAGLRFVHLPKERAQVLMRWIRAHQAAA